MAARRASTLAPGPRRGSGQRSQGRAPGIRLGRARAGGAAANQLEVGGNDVGQPLGGIDVGFRQRDGAAALKTRAPCTFPPPARARSACSLRSLGKGVRHLTLKHARQRCSSHRYQRKVGKRAPFARLQEDDSIAFGEPERESQLVERQKSRAFFRNQSGSSRRVRGGGQQAGNAEEQLRRWITGRGAAHRRWRGPLAP